MNNQQSTYSNNNNNLLTTSFLAPPCSSGTGITTGGNNSPPTAATAVAAAAAAAVTQVRPAAAAVATATANTTARILPFMYGWAASNTTGTTVGTTDDVMSSSAAGAAARSALLLQLAASTGGPCGPGGQSASNHSGPGTGGQPSYLYAEDIFFRHSFAVSAFYCLAYVTVFILGLFGNSFVVAVVYRSPRMRTVTNYFIVNLALADILVLIFCLPATLLGNIFVPWVLGSWMCKAVPYVQGLSVAASVLSLIAVSIDRFLAICFPLKCQITTRRARIIILFIWVVAVLMPLPWAFYFNLVPMNDNDDQFSDLLVCVEIWPDVESENLYFVVVILLLFYLVPLIIISYCYVKIWLIVWTRSIPGEVTKQEQMDHMMAKSKMKVVKMLVVVVVVFMLSWLPLYVIITVLKFNQSLYDETSALSGAFREVITLIVPLAQWLGSSNSCINPILYAFFNNKFRRGFVAIIRSKQCCGTLKYDLKPKGSTFRCSSSTTTTKSGCSSSYRSSTGWGGRGSIGGASGIVGKDNHMEPPALNSTGV